MSAVAYGSAAAVEPAGPRPMRRFSPATIIIYSSLIFFAIYLFLVDQGWTYVLQGLTWAVNQIAGI